MLSILHSRLNDLYQVACDYDIEDYVVTDAALARHLSADALLTNTEETLLVHEDEEGLAVSLFLDADMLSRLESARPLDRLCAGALDDLWKVVEGISHFNCVAWKATQERPVSLLELELQGEIDKFVTAMLLTSDQAETDLQNRLHGFLFGAVSYHGDLDEEQRERYRSANDYAARFCHRIARHLVNDEAVAIAELRDFYRLQFADKISHIHARGWA